MCVAPLILLSAVEGGEQSASHSSHFMIGEEAPVPIQQEAGWAPQPVWTIFFWGGGTLSPIKIQNCESSNPIA